MLLTATRSILLLPPSPQRREAATEVTGPAANLALLASAAERLQVPVFFGDDGAEAVVRHARDQLVLAMAPPARRIAAVPDAKQIFLVVDALPEADRPASDDLTSRAITPVTTEMVVFEWLERADSDDFRALLKLIR